MNESKLKRVYLNIYNFTPFNNCLGLLGIGAYHTGIQIFGIQFCYCVVSTNDHHTGVISHQPESTDFAFQKKVCLGSTTLSNKKIQKIIDQLSKKYICGKYHMFKFNCNHFSDQFAFQLLGSGIPEEIFRITKIAQFCCVCLPTGMISGKWAIEALEKENNNLEQQTIK